MNKFNFKQLLFIPLALLMVLSILSCETEESKGEKLKKEREKMILGSWKVQKLVTSNTENKPHPATIANAMFSFMSNGRFQIILGNDSEGTFTISPNGKVLTTLPDGANQNNEMDITFMNDKRMVIQNGMAPPQDFKFILVKL